MQKDLFDILSKKELQDIVSKQMEQIEQLKKEKTIINKNEYVYKQSTVTMLSRELGNAKRDKMIAKSLLFEIYDSLSDDTISIKDLLRYKQKIRDIFPDILNKNITNQPKEYGTSIE